MILRLQNLKTKLPAEQIMAEITSYNFLHRIRNLLCTTDYLKLPKYLVQHNLDNRVAAGPKALDLTFTRLKNWIAVLEPLVEKMKGRPRGREFMSSAARKTVLSPRTKRWNKCMLLTAAQRLLGSGGIMSSGTPAPSSPTTTSSSSARCSSLSHRERSRSL